MFNPICPKILANARLQAMAAHLAANPGQPRLWSDEHFEEVAEDLASAGHAEVLKTLVVANRLPPSMNATLRALLKNY